MKIIFYASKNTGPWLAAIASALSDAKVWLWTPEEAGRQADYAIVWQPPAELFASQKGLKAVFNIGAGVDGLMALPNLPGNVPIVRLNDAGMASQMAEYVCHALIRHVREFDVYSEQMKERRWKARRPANRMDFPVGVMGLGFIGARVAESAASFGYPTFGWSRSGKSAEHHRLCRTRRIGTSTRRAVRSACYLTAETQGILNAATLSKLKPDGYLINVARGRHLVEEDCWRSWPTAGSREPPWTWCATNRCPPITRSGPTRNHVTPTSH